MNNLTNGPPRSLKAAFDAAAAAQNSSGVSSGTESASEEDYDVLKQDPLALINQGGRDNGISNAKSTSSPLGAQESNTTTRSRPDPMRAKNIPITISKLNEKGKYILTADDKDLKEILRLGLERVNLAFLFTDRSLMIHRKTTHLRRRRGGGSSVTLYLLDSLQLLIDKMPVAPNLPSMDSSRCSGLVQLFI